MTCLLAMEVEHSQILVSAFSFKVQFQSKLTTKFSVLCFTVELIVLEVKQNYDDYAIPLSCEGKGKKKIGKLKNWGRGGSKLANTVCHPIL